MRRSLFIALAQFVICATIAQKRPLKDSLLSTVKQNQVPDTLRVRALNDLSKTYRLTFPDSTIYFSKQAYELAVKISDVPGISTSLNFIGIGCFYKGEYPEALKYQKQALDFSELHHL
ncbi:MAG TPA: tetratricopeptide repeat protein, partial [Cyclobacteriaceae bacterium]|nr:tetratricopeptide repeat protein [Cyclobacteriaceae bacterium]